MTYPRSFSPLMWRGHSCLPRRDSSRRFVQVGLTNSNLRQRGSALVAVLWLSAAVSVIALALAAQVRNEGERASAYSQSLRAYYLATGSIQRAFLWMQWGPSSRQPDGSPMFYKPPAPRMLFSYPDGVAVVEVIPESAKLSLNAAKPQELATLMLALGAPLQRAQLISAAILDWRSGSSGSGATGNGAGPFDAVYSASSFLAPHASFKQLEELLLVRGMTTDLFYGHFGPNATGEMVYYPGIRDCVTTYTSGSAQFDINSVPVPVLEAVGWPPAAARAVESRRARFPFKTMTEVAQFVPSELMGRVGLGGGNFITLRATSTLRTPGGRPVGLKRTVSAVIKAGVTSGAASDPRNWVVLRWYDNEASPVLPQAAFGAPPPLSASTTSTETIGGTGDTPAPAAGTDEPVRVYRPGSAEPAPSSPAAPDKNATAPPSPATGTAPPKKEVMKVYHVSGSGAVEESPPAPKKP